MCLFAEVEPSISEALLYLLAFVVALLLMIPIVVGIERFFQRDDTRNEPTPPSAPTDSDSDAHSV